jgi:hypothetical protein
MHFSLIIHCAFIEFFINISIFPRIFHWDFIWMPGIFQQIFHFIPEDISLGFSYGCLVFSIDISKCSIECQVLLSGSTLYIYKMKYHWR